MSQRDAKTPQLQVSGGLSNQAKDGEPGALLVSLGLGDPVNAPPYASQLHLSFPPGEGWKPITVTLAW